jgi:hypothetical protein
MRVERACVDVQTFGQLPAAPIHQEKRQPDLTFLESDIIDAANMAYIATELLEHNLSQQDTTFRSQSLHYLTEDDVERSDA